MRWEYGLNIQNVQNVAIDENILMCFAGVPITGWNIQMKLRPKTIFRLLFLR